MKIDAPPHDFFVAGGTLWGDAPSYVVRPADEELYRLAQAGEYCSVLAARQMGKSSLMVRTASRLNAAGIRTAILDISALGGGLAAPEAWFFGFLDELAVQLGLPAGVDAWWEARTRQNPAQRFSSFLREVVLAEIPNRIAVFVDEIDSALGMGFTDDFFAAIRAAYNARAAQPDFQRLTFILLGVARPADLIRDRSRTPYNIGEHISLSGFSLPELQPFQEVFEGAYPGQGRQIVEWVLDWTSGQPYLTQKACAELVRRPRSPCTPELVAQTIGRLFLTDEARKESNLRAIRDRLESSPHKTEMLHIYGRILRGRTVEDEERSTAKTELKLTGLVCPSPQGRLEVQNRIYRTVYDLAWVRKNLPASRARQAAFLSAGLALLAFAIAGYAVYRQQIQPALTFAEQFRTSSSPDVRLTSLARLLELDPRSASQAQQLYASLPHGERLGLFTELSSPQNVSAELVTVIEGVYQDNPDSPAGNELLSAMRTVLGQVGAAGAPSLKTEIEFWIRGRQLAGEPSTGLTAVSFYDSAWAESVSRGRPNYAVRFDRASALIALGSFGPALGDLQAVWEHSPARRAEVAAAIQAHPALAALVLADPAADPALLAFITPMPFTATAEPAPKRIASPTAPPPPAATPSPTLAPTTAAAQLAPYAGWIAYGYGEGAGREIFILDPATGLQRQVTNNAFMDEAPAFSPDTATLAYASQRSQGGWELYAYDLVRGTERQLTAFDGQARFPVWSPVPGDPRIVFEGRAPGQESVINIWLFDAATGEAEQLTRGGADSRPAWAPDGTRIIFGRATADTTGDGRITVNDSVDIYSLDLLSRTETNLTNTPAFDDFGFAWSPDGEWIAFTSVRFDANGDGVLNLTDSRDLFLLHSASGDERRLNLGGGQISSPSWSPDGRHILFLVMQPDGQSELWRVDARTESAARLAGPGPFHHPRFAGSP